MERSTIEARKHFKKYRSSAFLRVYKEVYREDLKVTVYKELMKMRSEMMQQGYDLWDNIPWLKYGK